MADNILVSQGVGTTIATDDIGGVQYQRVKLSQGADGSATDVSSAAPLQVTLANTSANATAVKVDGSAVTQPVSGTVTASAQPGVDIGDVTINNASGASAVNIQDGGNSITVDGTVSATQSGTWTLGANSGVDIGDVTINNASGASAVNIQDGGNSITVDGTVAATQSGTWNVTNVSGTVSLPTGAATAANQSTETWTNAGHRVFGVKNVATVGMPGGIRTEEKGVTGKTGMEIATYGYIGFKLWATKTDLIVDITLA